MKTKDSSHFTLFQDRNLNDAVFPPRKPDRFSTEPEGEGMEICLRGLLLACLVAGMMMCGVHLDNVAKSQDPVPALPDGHTAVACVQPVASPAADRL